MYQIYFIMHCILFACVVHLCLLYNFYNIFYVTHPSYTSFHPQMMFSCCHLSYKEVCPALSGDGTGRGGPEPLQVVGGGSSPC